MEAVQRAAEYAPVPSRPVLTPEGFLSLCRMPPLQVCACVRACLIACACVAAARLLTLLHPCSCTAPLCPTPSTSLPAPSPAAGPQGSAAQADLCAPAAQRAAPAGHSVCPGCRVCRLLTPREGTAQASRWRSLGAAICVARWCGWRSAASGCLMLLPEGSNLLLPALPCSPPPHPTPALQGF